MNDIEQIVLIAAEVSLLLAAMWWWVKQLRSWL